jgi:hypothetical protein
MLTLTENNETINVKEHGRGNQEMDNSEKLAALGLKPNKTPKKSPHHYAQTCTNNVNKTCALLQTTGGKDEPNIVLCGNRNRHDRNSERKDT